jgi:rRNA maturation endonuclease Nob1
MDMADMAFDAEQENIQHCMYNVKNKKQKHSKLKPQGYCHACFNDFDDPNKLFCGPMCAEQYERALRLKN